MKNGHRNALISSLVALSCFVLPAFAEPVVKVGVILPLTGPVAEYGVAARNGFEIARREASDHFRSIEFLFEDSAYDSKQALAGFQKLQTVDNVDIVFNWGTEPSLALAPIAEKARMPFVTVSHDPRVGAGRQFTIRFINPSRDFAKKQADYLLTKAFKRVGVLKTELSYFNSLLEDLKASVGTGVSLEVIQNFQATDQDFSIAIAQARTRGYDAICVFLLTGQIAQYYRQAAQLHFSVPTIGSDVFDSAAEVKESAGLMTGAVFANIRVDDQFRGRYKKTYGDDVQVQYAGNAYDFANLLAEIVKTNGKAANFIDAMAKQKTRRGVTGEYHLVQTPAEGRYFSFPIILKKIEGTEIVPHY